MSDTNEVSAVIVTGLRIRAGAPSGGGGGSGDQVDPNWTQMQLMSSDYEGKAGTSNQPCYPSAPQDDKELANAIDGKVAEVAGEIVSRSGAFGDMTVKREYGSVVYMGADGKLHHTPLQEPVDFRANINYSSLPGGGADYSTVVAIIHSHPPGYFDANYPEYLVFPSEPYQHIGVLIGDWLSYASLVDNVRNAGGNPNIVEQYVLGWVEKDGFRGWRLHKWDPSKGLDSQDGRAGVVPDPEIDLALISCDIL